MGTGADDEKKSVVESKVEKKGGSTTKVEEPPRKKNKTGQGELEPEEGPTSVASEADVQLFREKHSVEVLCEEEKGFVAPRPFLEFSEAPFNKNIRKALSAAGITHRTHLRYAQHDNR